jgi:hypothetical protein
MDAIRSQENPRALDAAAVVAPLEDADFVGLRGND